MIRSSARFAAEVALLTALAGVSACRATTPAHLAGSPDRAVAGTGSGDPEPPPASVDGPLETDTDLPPPVDTDTGVPTPAVELGRPFGFWGLNGYHTPEGLADVTARFHATLFQMAAADPKYAVKYVLPMVRAAGMHVTLRMTPDHEAYTNPYGDFDLQAWKGQLGKWQGSGVQAFIDDGTLAGHMLLDDIRTFPERNPDAADLDEMARYSKEIFPGLVTFVREDATALPRPKNDSHTYTYLDATVNQYSARKGDVAVYASTQAARAAELGLGVINGLNIADGGDGSSGQPGWRSGKWAMSADEIARYGAALANVPTCGMLLAWEYDGEERWSDGTIGSTYFDQPSQQAALAELGALVATQPKVTLLRSSPSQTSSP